MTPNTKLKTRTPPPARAALPPLLDASRDWPENGSEAPELAPDAVKSDALAGESAAHEDVPRVVGGVTPACGEAAAALLQASTKLVHVVPSADVAEMTKLNENTFRAVNIALANEFANICHELGMEARSRQGSHGRAAAAYTHAAGEGLR
jgi:hypothetical protein